jgi:hypothetical protein
MQERSKASFHKDMANEERQISSSSSLAITKAS